MTRFHSLRLTASALALCALTVGCGPSGPATYAVFGTVTYNDEPIPNEHNGYITFVPDDKSIGPESAPIMDGKFSFRAREGTKTVKIEATRFLPGRDDVAMGMRPKEMYIPENYNAVTELTAEVKPNDENEYTFELTDKK